MSGTKMFENFLFNYNMTFIKFTKVKFVFDLPLSTSCLSGCLHVTETDWQLG